MVGTTRLSMPRRPAWTAAVRKPSREASRTGTQSATRTQQPAGGRTGRADIQDERVRGGYRLDPSLGHDGGVDLVHPGQVPVRLEPEQRLEPATVTMNTLRVVSDVERQVPSAVGRRLPVTSSIVVDAGVELLNLCADTAPARDGTGPQATGGEIPAGPRTQVHLDQVFDPTDVRVTHV